MLIEALTRATRRLLVGGSQRFILAAPGEMPRPPVNEIALYVHIPFCKTMCPYCPYNRIAYDETAAETYIEALLREIRLQRERLGHTTITSVYFGGGTPTTLLKGMRRVLDELRRDFPVTGPVAVETTPTDMTPETVRELRDMGVTHLSLGIQSFQNRHLKTLARTHDHGQASEALALTVAAGFNAVNVDLMFALPGQSTADLLADVETALALGVDQITAYPLFTFPYTTIGRFLELRHLEMPSIWTRRHMYRSLSALLLTSGFRRASVWGFVRGAETSYSSVTRDRYLGLGAGAWSVLPGVIYCNTFSVPGYAEACERGRLPVSLSMPLTRELQNYYWLYWRLYETRVDLRQLERRFGPADRRLGALLAFMRATGLATNTTMEADGSIETETDVDGDTRGGARTGSTLTLTERGCFWVHLAQNYFLLSYIDTAWAACLREAWPRKVRL